MFKIPKSRHQRGKITLFGKKTCWAARWRGFPDYAVCPPVEWRTEALRAVCETCTRLHSVPGYPVCVPYRYPYPYPERVAAAYHNTAIPIPGYPLLLVVPLVLKGTGWYWGQHLLCWIKTIDIDSSWFTNGWTMDGTWHVHHEIIVYYKENHLQSIDLCEIYA